MTRHHGPLYRTVQRISATRGFARVAPRVLPAVDRAVHRLTKGRVLPSARMLPGVVLTARGAKSGLPRTIPLAALHQITDATETTDSTDSTDSMNGAADNESWLLVGSNFGRAGHPAWSGNLLAQPDAEINWRGRDIPVRARLLEGGERERAWAELIAFWPPYATYQERTERRIRLFRLTRR
ncbi:nitroreductase family deazaflavin-dependent oxidoreductase [Streptomyces qinzhouensis]|uniref:Nitroreductase family deazaflavin-dependent oxidoreductase n=1 Tax=Streptomyces qinzhouensis TaxID=2599401 RepID=A0A5B8J7I1_9ACTN|nr:nitroreductase family deazaflavin-dependent oxidoreductase [Streptomyces qinzhouensis]QDY77347.1 nitroreductase family deazaflavin-dependent oxidoreductase [Streptomyces qinzhouensis]